MRLSPPWVALLASLACSIDDRTLLPAADESAGRGGALGGGEAGAAGIGGSGGEGGSESACADLDTDGVPDCSVTLVANSTFARDVDAWTALEDAELEWDAMNALDDLPSGSAKLSAALPLARASQCVRLEGEQLVIAYANAFVEAPEDAEGALALLDVSFFPSEDCGGLREGFFETPPSAVLNAWTTIHAGGLSKPTTSSASITLLGAKAPGTTGVSSYFDNVMLKAEDLN